jgi:feruloyl esterase
MFPHDFDGIVIGAPAVDFNNLVSWRASFFPITGPIRSTDFISAPTWTTLIHNEILWQCDGIDGVMDGIIEDPDLCHFNPETLLCSTPQSNAGISANASAKCLTAGQVAQVTKIFSPFTYENGTLIYPAMQPGSEIMAVNKLYAGAPFSYSEVLYFFSS